ncbi:MAG: FAD-dependent oxidoreductase [Nitrospiraceae bacterium]|nr:FAD-dependent oxidoreductase [Nitrospiraceae bacterium]
MDPLPQKADIVIIGGGVMGLSTAYNLVKRGAKDVVVIERDEFFGQESTGKCAGGIRHQFSSKVNIELSKLSIGIMEHFEEEFDQPIDLNFCGYLFVIASEELVPRFQKIVELQRSLGIDTEWLTTRDILKKVPILNVEDIIAGTFYGRDGLADPSSVVQGYVKMAHRLGATLVTDTTVTGIRVEKGKITAVETDKGIVETHVVVNATGAWSKEIGKMVGVDIPILPYRRQIAVTAPMEEIPKDLPMVVEYPNGLYFHRESGGLLTGMSNPDEKPDYDTTVDSDWMMSSLDALMHRLPAAEKASLRTFWAGLYEITPDAHPIMGKMPEPEGFYCVAGFSGHGFMHGPGAGVLMAEEILDGRAHTVDIDRLRYERFLRPGAMEREQNVI